MDLARIIIVTVAILGSLMLLAGIVNIVATVMASSLLGVLALLAVLGVALYFIVTRLGVDQR